MHYYIDGYNLMFRQTREGIKFQAQRASIIKELDERADSLNLDITIVFDAQYQYGLGSRSHFRHVEICFTDGGETADEYILNALKRAKKPQQETVVTSDKQLASSARGYLAKTQSVEQFMTWLSKRRKHSEQCIIENTSIVKPIKETTAIQIESDMERWLRIFEGRTKHYGQDSELD